MTADLSMRDLPRDSSDSGSISTQFNQYKTEKYPEPFFIFSDGSKSDDYVGAAFTSVMSEGHFRLTVSSSVLTAELFAMYRAPTSVQDVKNKRLVIASDSISSLKCLQPHLPPHPLVLIRELTSKLERGGKTITFMWLPSHSGIIENKRADYLAKKREGSLTENFLFWSSDMKQHSTRIFRYLDQLR
ncbi:uncharacterized protein LOC143196359 [Rhynchophorus ferrugineus]|uniref:uncharacterized protein LOC143196359 n=1 Tax=Rhynchophorus ferrugineus TaxID=354439 RepID=UPI003FCE07C6